MLKPAEFLSAEDLRELKALFGQLSMRQQDFLITRFPLCQSDAEACRLMQPKISSRAIRQWKSEQPVFRRAYELLSRRCFDIQRWLAESIINSTVVRAALEQRSLIERPWEKLTAREASAKTQLITDVLDRVLPKTKRSEHVINVRDVNRRIIDTQYKEVFSDAGQEGLPSAEAPSRD